MRYCIERICPTGDVSEKFGDYSDEKEANRNAELLNIVDPFNYYKVKKEETFVKARNEYINSL